MLIAYLFETCLHGEWPQFLAASWVGDQTPVVRTRSLLIFNAFLQSRLELDNEKASKELLSIDYQVILPTLLVALSDAQTNVRAAACKCLKTLTSMYEAAPKKSKSRKSLGGSTLGMHKHDLRFMAITRLNSNSFLHTSRLPLSMLWLQKSMS